MGQGRKSPFPIGGGKVANATMSPKLRFRDDEKLKKINRDTLKLWDKYKIDMTLRELSKKTIAGYTNDFEHFLIYIYDNFDNKCVTDMDEDDITEFLYHCKTNGNNSRRIKRRMSTISAFYKFLRKKRIIQESPMDFITRPKGDVDVITQSFLTQEQVNLMREKLRECGDLDLYLYAMFSLSTMARVNAVSSVRWEQIDFGARVVNEVLEKEAKIVVLYFSEEAKELLLQVKAQRKAQGIEDNGWVFHSRFDKSVSPI
jgi:site-specific recombinase XerD